MKTIREWCKDSHEVAVTHGFITTDENLLERLMLVVTEVAEAAEAWRKNDPDHIPEELADIVIRVFDIAEARGIDLEFAIAAKQIKNREREFMHGGKRA